MKTPTRLDADTVAQIADTLARVSNLKDPQREKVAKSIGRLIQEYLEDQRAKVKVVLSIDGLTPKASRKLCADVEIAAGTLLALLDGPIPARLYRRFTVDHHWALSRTLLLLRDVAGQIKTSYPKGGRPPDGLRRDLEYSVVCVLASAGLPIKASANGVVARVFTDVHHAIGLSERDPMKSVREAIAMFRPFGTERNPGMPKLSKK